MKELLFLAHRIPYPPNKGDKIRSYHMLRHLAQRYRVHLATFVDDPDDWRHVPEVQTLCGETCFVPLRPMRATLRSLSGLLTGEALTLPYYRSRVLAAWVARLLAERRIERVLVFSSAMAQYVDGPPLAARRVLDFVDMDSDKWSQYAAKRHWPSSWVYGREARALFRAERRWAGEFDASLFVSDAEAGLFRKQAPEVAHKIFAVDNGVDTDYFSPRPDYPRPYPTTDQVLVFTGAMDYWANVDAVAWFAQKVFPAVRAQLPRSRFYIVGSRPTKDVLRLGEQPGVHVTGTVPDVRPYVGHAHAAVAPLRIARGVQNKVLEAMAMAKPVIASPQAMDGLRGWETAPRLVTDDPAEMARMALALLTGADRTAYGEHGRECVLRHYSWHANLGRLESILENMPVSLTVADR